MERKMEIIFCNNVNGVENAFIFKKLIETFLGKIQGDTKYYIEIDPFQILHKICCIIAVLLS